MSIDISRRNFLAGTGAAAAALALGACGNAANSGGAADGKKTKLTFCLDYTPNTNHTGIYVAQAKGYFADEGLGVEIVQPADDTAEAMIGSGKAQVGVSYQDYIANALDSDSPMPIQAIAAVIQHNTSGIMSRKADGITRPKAMMGHKYATWDMPVEQATIKHIVEKDGGDFSKLDLVPYNVDDEVSGLKADMFDSVWVYEGWAVQNAVVQDFDYNYFSFISIDKVFDYYTPVLAANSEYAQKNPEVIKAFLRAAKRGYEYAISNHADAAQILLDAVPELDEKLVKQSAEYLAGEYQSDADSWGIIEKDRWSAFYKWLNDNKLVKHELDVNAGWTMDYLEA